MPTIFIHDTPIRVQDQFAAGHHLSGSEADLLNETWMGLFLARLRWFAGKTPEATPAVMHAEARRVAEVLELSTDSSEADPVWDEAMTISREIITTQLAAAGLPPPPNLEIHAEALLDASEDILVQARNRVEIRRRVANQALGALEMVL